MGLGLLGVTQAHSSYLWLLPAPMFSHKFCSNSTVGLNLPNLLGPRRASVLLVKPYLLRSTDSNAIGCQGSAGFATSGSLYLSAITAFLGSIAIGLVIGFAIGGRFTFGCNCYYSITLGAGSGSTAGYGDAWR